MCGINGTSAVNPKIVETMSAATRHRGPDGTEVQVFSRTTLGHNRLAIIDVSTKSNQPMTSHEGRYVIVFNGEIYNYRELREELRQVYQFKTEGDTEVLLAAYIVWGKAALDRVQGIFAFAILDTLDDSITLVRDHLGVKPLYYAIKNGTLYFSSELSGLIAAGFTGLNKEITALYLYTQYIPSPETLISGVYKLEPGQILKFTDSGVHLEKYKLPAASLPLSQSPVKDVIGRAITRQIVSDREIGLFLSGGLDSSIVLHHLAAQVPSIRTFSLGFELEDVSEENTEKFNFDVNTAAKTAAFYHVPHTSFTLTHHDIAVHLEGAFMALDEPVANPTAFTKYMLSKWVREHGVVVAFGGDGGDELFKGYPRYRNVYFAEQFQRLPSLVRNVLIHAKPGLSRLNQSLDSAFHTQMMLNASPVMGQIWKEGVPAVTLLLGGIVSKKYEEYTNQNGAAAFMTADRSLWLPDESLHSTDRASMAHGVEYRVPLLDQEITQYADSFSVNQHLRYGKGKHMLWTAYKDLLPKHLFNQRKRGWLSPAAKWLRNKDVNKLVRHIMSDSYAPNLSGLIDWTATERVLDQHCNQEVYALNPLWNILQLQVWAKSKGLHL